LGVVILSVELGGVYAITVVRAESTLRSRLGVVMVAMVFGTQSVYWAVDWA
jgi:hypothetical protein